MRTSKLHASGWCKASWVDWFSIASMSKRVVHVTSDQDLYLFFILKIITEWYRTCQKRKIYKKENERKTNWWSSLSSMKSLNIVLVTLTLSISFPVCVVNYIFKYKTGRLHTLFPWWYLFIPLLHLKSLHVSAVLWISHHQVVIKLKNLYTDLFRDICVQVL
jgi:hypothetical protein